MGKVLLYLFLIPLLAHAAWWTWNNTAWNWRSANWSPSGILKPATADPEPVVVEPAESAAGQTHIQATLGATGRIAARWHPRVSRTPEMELLTSVTNLTQILIEDGLVRTDAWLTFDVLRGTLSQVRLEAPSDQRILDVTSPARLKVGEEIDE